MHCTVSHNKGDTTVLSSSSRMTALIADFNLLTVALHAIDHAEDPFGWQDVANTRCRALDALLDERPTSLSEFAAKFQALVPVTEEDSDLTILHILAEDICWLAGA